MKKITVENAMIEGRERILLIFPFDKELVRLVRMIPGATFNPSIRYWHIALSQANLNRLADRFRDIAEIDLERLTINRLPTGKVMIADPLRIPLDDQDKKWLGHFSDWMTYRRYSPSTIRTYGDIVSTYLRFIKPETVSGELGDNFQRFTNGYILPKRLSLSYQNQAINALRLFYKQVLKKDFEPGQLARPRREYRLPNVLSKEEVRKLLEVTSNPKHRAMLSLIYACGLRCGELLNLLPQHIDSDRGLLIIKQAKGKKDRIVPLSEKMILQLRDYFRQYRPKKWLFEGQVEGRQYDERSLQQVLKKAIRLSGILKPVTLHWLRHSYATHLLESGVDLRYIQEILGHSRSRTTEIYTHVSTKSIQQIRSPFDDL